MLVMYLEYDVAEYFDLIRPLSGTDVLDWGCNHANMLKYGCEPRTYTGVDIDLSVITANQSQWPQHRWAHYDQYNGQYNSSLTTTGQWPLGEQDRFDNITAFSVFTHTDFAEYAATTKRLRAHLTEGGKLMTTFISNSDFEMFGQILQHRPEYFSGGDYAMFDDIQNSYHSVLVVVPSSREKHLFMEVAELPKFNKPVYFLSFYNDQWLSEQLGGTIARPDLTFESGIRMTQRCLVSSTLA